MPRVLSVVVELFCFVYTVLPGSLRDDSLSDKLAQCAVTLANTTESGVNSTLFYSQLSKSVCRNDDVYTGCMEFTDTVYIQTDRVSHTNTTSTVQVEINPNFTGGIEEFYFAFCVSYNKTSDYELVACAANSSGVSEIEHYWETNGLVHLRVGIFTDTSRRDPIGCNVTKVIVAGNFGLKLGMDLYADEHTFPSDPVGATPPLLTSYSALSPITNNTNNTYTTGNLTFVPKPDITMGNHSLYEYVYKYDFGDNSTIEEHSTDNTTHFYKRPGNYLYLVEGYAIKTDRRERAYHASYKGTVVIVAPVANVSLFFNHNDSITVDTSVYLHVCANGSFPITVCWRVQQANHSTPSTIPCSPPSSNSSADELFTCHDIQEEYPCPSYEMSFTDTGMYEMVATFANTVSCVRVIYTFHVVAASKPPIIATTTSAGVVLAITIAVVVVLIILAVGGYLPYRRYRNRMIETADFKFIDLSERKPSAWTRFKRRLSQLLHSRRNTDKIGLVNLISEPGRGPACSSRSSSNSSSSSCSSTGSLNHNYNTI